jgi:hypothetical protein
MIVFVDPRLDEEADLREKDKGGKQKGWTEFFVVPVYAYI